MASPSLPATPPAWLKQLPAEVEHGLTGATMSSYLTPAEIIAKEVGGELWTAYSLKAYCTVRFGEPQAYGNWLLATEVPGFLILVKSEPGLAVGQFGYRWPQAMEERFYEEWKHLTDARLSAWEPYRDQSGLVLPQASHSGEDRLRYKKEVHALYDRFIADGSEARALATVHAPLTEVVHATIRNLGREMMRPVQRPGHGRKITMADAKMLRTAPAP